MRAAKYRENGGLKNSFSRNHTINYSAIALQEMNLYHYYPHIYWQCAVLTVNASADPENQSKDSTNYGKIAKAIGNMQQQGVRIALPDVNTADYGFKPDQANNQIIFGLKGISGIGDELAERIVANVPYNSLEDFCIKATPTTTQLIALVKAGALDALYHDLSRTKIMELALEYLATASADTKDSLGLRNLRSIQEFGIVPNEFCFALRLNAYRTYIKRAEFATKVGKSKAARLDGTALLFFDGELRHMLKEGADYHYQGEDTLIILSKFERVYETIIEPLKKWLESPDTLSLYNVAAKNAIKRELRTKYIHGGTSRWEMDALSFYYGEHELNCINNSAYGIVPFGSLPETPIIVDTPMRKIRMPDGTTKEVTYNRFQLSRIAGTVLDKDKIRSSVTLLTTDGVVTVKFYDGAFVHYNKQISRVLGEGKKEVVEKPWFKRGNLLIVTGFRRGDTFFPRTYRDSIYQHTVNLITQIYPDGTLELKTERTRVDGSVDEE